MTSEILRSFEFIKLLFQELPARGVRTRPQWTCKVLTATDAQADSAPIGGYILRVVEGRGAGEQLAGWAGPEQGGRQRLPLTLTLAVLQPSRWGWAQQVQQLQAAPQPQPSAQHRLAQQQRALQVQCEPWRAQQAQQEQEP